MSTEDYKAIVHRNLEEIWNQGKVALIDELYAPTSSSVSLSRQREAQSFRLPLLR